MMSRSWIGLLLNCLVAAIVPALGNAWLADDSLAGITAASRLQFNPLLAPLLSPYPLAPTVFRGAEPHEVFRRGRTEPAVRHPGVPEVALIGDSISIGYAPAVRAVLSGSYDVLRPGGDMHNWYSSTEGLRELPRLFPGTAAVTVFNFGLWDLAYRYPVLDDLYNCDFSRGHLSTDAIQYEKNLGAIASYIRAHSTVVIWVDTTPIPPGNECRYPGAEIPYNAIADRVMSASGFYILTLHPDTSYRKPVHNVHFYYPGYFALGHQVAVCILTAARGGSTSDCRSPHVPTGAEKAGRP